MRESAASAADKIKETTGGTNLAGVAEVAGEKAGGMIGSVLGAVGKAADAVASGGGAAAAATVSGPLNLLADQIDGQTGKISADMNECAAKVVKDQRQQIVEAYVKSLNEFEFPNPEQLIRGKGDCYKPEEELTPDVKWEKICENNGDAISNAFNPAVRAALEKSISLVVADKIKEQPVTKAWDAMIKQTNEVLEKVEPLLGKIGVEPIDFDLPEYILKRIISKIEGDIALHERTVRGKVREHAANSRRPLLFPSVFSVKELSNGDFAELKKQN